MIKGYKGFDKDMKCRGYQYELGKEYSHTGTVKTCENGFHFCENPLDVFKYYPMTGSKFAEVEGDGKVDKGSDDSKVSCSSLRIGAEITLSAMIQGAVKFIFEKASVKKEGNAAASGNYGNAAASGESGNAAASGASGNAAASGKNSIAASIGKGGTAKAALGNWIVLAEWSDNWEPMSVKSVKVDGKKIKADTFYRLKGGKFVKA